MEQLRDKLRHMNVLICGLAYTSRTETLEDYLKDRTNSLTVISPSSCFLKENLSSCRVYQNGVLKNKFKIPNFRIEDYKWYRQPLILLVFLVYLTSISWALIKVKKRYDIYIGISHSFALWGIFFKKLKIIKNMIYYCIDYYIPSEKIGFNTLFVKFINIIDRFTVKNSDYIWDISPNILEYREKIAKIRKGNYKNTVVPLGYSSHLRRFKAMEEIDRWGIGFVGSISINQGLQLLIETLPLVLRQFPQVKVTVIGQGPFLSELKKIVSQENLDEYFKFTGFIKNEDEMLGILSECAIAVALYNDSIENRNIVCADPGKTKLYSLCGLPIITTKTCILAEEIKLHKAGVIIDYQREDLKNAIVYLLSSEERLKEFRTNSFNLGQAFISDNIFDKAFFDFFNN